jgi:hypothetical protein
VRTTLRRLIHPKEESKRMRKFTRIGVLVLVVAGVLGSSTQPAAAAEALTVVFTGTATVGNSPDGLAFPCVNGGTVSLADCPIIGTPISVQNLPTPHNPLTFIRPVFHDGDSAGFNFTSTTCAAADVATVGAHTLGAGTCSMAANGVVHGYCGLAEGFLVGGLAVSSNSLVPTAGHGTRFYQFTGRFVTVGAVSVLRGSITNTTSGETGEFTVVTTSAPIAGDCTDNSSTKTAIVVGTGEAVL